MQQFRSMLESRVPDGFVQGNLVDRSLLLSIVTRGFADLSVHEMAALEAEIDGLGSSASAGRLLTTVLRALGPGFEKIGQFLGNRPDLLSPADRAELAALSSEGRPIASSIPERAFRRALQSRLNELLGPPTTGGESDLRPVVDDLIEHFEPTPLGTGSIGQTHLVRLRGGQVVVWKTVKPGARERLTRNFGAVLEVLEASGEGAFRDLITSMREQSLRETDLRNEAASIDQARAALLGHGVQVPRIVDGMVNEGGLLMELAPGRHGAAGLDARARAARADALFQGVLYLVFFADAFHGDPHRGNVLSDEASISLIDWGLTGSLTRSERLALVAVLGGVAAGSESAALRGLRRLTGTLSPAQTEMVRQILRQRRGAIESVRDLFFSLQADGVRVPVNVVQAAKALALAEGVALEIDPGWRPRVRASSLPRLLLHRRAPISRSMIVEQTIFARAIELRRESNARLRTTLVHRVGTLRADPEAHAASYEGQVGLERLTERLRVASPQYRGIASAERELAGMRGLGAADREAALEAAREAEALETWTMRLATEVEHIRGISRVYEVAGAARAAPLDPSQLDAAPSELRSLIGDLRTIAQTMLSAARREVIGELDRYTSDLARLDDPDAAPIGGNAYGRMVQRGNRRRAQQELLALERRAERSVFFRGTTQIGREASAYRALLEDDRRYLRRTERDGSYPPGHREHALREVEGALAVEEAVQGPSLGVRLRRFAGLESAPSAHIPTRSPARSPSHVVPRRVPTRSR